MRAILAVAAAFALIAGPASAQQVFRCDQEGNAFYYRIGPGEFRHWVGAGNGYAARWLDNNCTMYGSTCSWTNGVLTLDDTTIDWRQEFDTNTGFYRWGSLDDYPEEVQCSRASDPPPA